MLAKEIIKTLEAATLALHIERETRIHQQLQLPGS